ncbi:MAG TPA: T9SS type A sorting domain-containing protein [Chitinophagales bacterium]|nr:T9SS type A sorting domain-containing protein [Chitinophagales bacterium]
MKKQLITLVLFLIVVYASAQKQAAKWYFGNYAGIDFLSGSPVPFSGSAMAMLEGVASIADTAGNTLFYTNGSQVWNRNNAQMPNGFGLLGDNNSAQAAIIVPDPGNANQYYIFTTPTWGTGAMNYSLVDMTLQSGLGDVTDKNVFMFNNSTEKVTAVRHSNGTDIWVVGHEWLSNNFYSFLITPAGVNLTPVITSVGSVHSGTLGFAGYMKASHHGHKIAYAITISLNLVELLDFDNATGIPSNPVTINNVDEAYGLEFSPDDSRLYATLENPQIIYQWDVNAGSAADIIASQTDVGPGIGSDAYAALQLAPDGKIYLANRFSSYLGVINDPNALGVACNFVDNAVTLSSGTSEYGLPNFFQSFFDTTAITSSAQSNFAAADTDICEKFCIDYFDSSTNNPVSWLWNFPGGNPSTSSLQNPINICYQNPGLYDVTLITSNANGVSDTLTVSNYITVYTNPFAPVITQNGNTLTSTSAISYQWQLNSVNIPGATNQSYTITQSGLYTVIIGDANGCNAQASVDASLVGISEAGENSFINFYPNPAADELMVEWSDGLAGHDFTISLVSAVGQEVFSSSQNNSHGGNTEIDLSNIASGVYFIEIKSEYGFVKRKILIAK